MNDLTELLLKIGQLTNKRYSRQQLRLRIARSEGHEALVERPVPPHAENRPCFDAVAAYIEQPFGHYSESNLQKSVQSAEKIYD